MKLRLGLLVLLLATSFVGTGCSLFAVASDDAIDEDPQASAGALITDSSVVIDDFYFSEAVCAEFVQSADSNGSDGGFANEPKPDSGTGIALIVTSIACWKAQVIVFDSNEVAIDSFAQTFGIFGQRDGDKERGHVGYLTWKPSERNLNPAAGNYLWRIRFDFGLNRKLPLRAWVPWPTR